MAVVYVNEVPPRSGAWDQDSNHRYTQTFQVYTDDPNTCAGDVLSAEALPQFGDLFTQYAADGVTILFQDPQSKCIDVRADQSDEENFQNWRVTCEFVALEDPTAVPAEIEIDPVPYQKALTVDVNGKAIVNSANDPFEHGVTVDRSRWRLTIVQNILYDTFDPVKMAAYNDSTNSNTFLATKFANGFPAGTCKLQIGVQRMKQSDNNTFYWRRKAVIDINILDQSEVNAGKPLGWGIELRDAGYQCKGIIASTAVITLPGGQRPTSPQLLNGAGAPLALTPGAKPVALPFTVYPRMDWSQLGLENW